MQLCKCGNPQVNLCQCAQLIGYATTPGGVLARYTAPSPYQCWMPHALMWSLRVYFKYYMGSATHLHGHADKLLVHLLRWCVVLVV
eukprot:COSAG05_NODE_1739_length_4161_cov_4.587642_2_plen_86_part_00